MDVKTVVTYNTVISACAKAGEVGMAKSLLQRMTKHGGTGVRPDIVSFNSVISACANQSRWKDALRILDKCHRTPGVDPDIITYTNAMRACAKGGNPERALMLLQVVKDKGLRLDNYCYAAVIDACAKGKMWKRALELLEEMREQHGITPNEIAYSVTITACGNGGQWKKSLELLEQMKSLGLNVNLITYNAVITALSKAARRNTRNNRAHDKHDDLWKKALELLDEIKEKGYEPDGFSYSAAITCCGAGGKWEEALGLIRKMQKGGPRSRPNKVAFSAAISACGRSGRHKEALELFTDMKEQGLQPDIVAYNAVFSALRVAEEPDEAYRLWQEMCGKAGTSSIPSTKIATARADGSVHPDIITITDVIGALSHEDGGDIASGNERSKRRIDAVFREAVSRGIVLKGTLDSSHEIDLSGLSLPVARAAVRYIFRDIEIGARGEAKQPQDAVVLITGVGKAWIPRGSNHIQQQDSDGLPLRDLVQQVLLQDFDPPIKSLIPRLAQGTVEVSKEEVESWLSKTRP
eukprot:CAMPEP_0202461078 /NCGR_PEP_ID=MMETSP1360-20130828/47667_1 /ASSEMBLY_ACC=CAM_ASM_000848 /TAXON_ID=515479 /ORGANISM="Licmophora paradoxa, Strain CCMP2313" /LENGTH=522 /DNA_ID=CAMNT_0049082991 /DNA_START=131 /DNA_END=1696 /DNA_ORIENTATION=-